MEGTLFKSSVPLASKGGWRRRPLIDMVEGGTLVQAVMDAIRDPLHRLSLFAVAISVLSDDRMISRGLGLKKGLCMFRPGQYREKATRARKALEEC
jgi:hypothetical protein